MAYQPRTYRQYSASDDLVGFAVSAGESDLHIQAEADLSELAVAAVREARQQIEGHIALRPEFATALKPLRPPAEVSEVVGAMYQAAQWAGVGPMAAVAGAIAEFVGQRLLDYSSQVIVENGGDILLVTDVPRLVAIRAGDSPLSGRVGLVIPAGQRLGICTSSGTVGPSVSMGRAQAAVVVADSAAFADAAATALGNRVRSPEDCEAAIEWVQQLAGVRGAVVVCDATLATWGEFELQPLPRRRT